MGSKRYLVTGGAGFIGSALVKSLLQDGHSVVVLDNLQRGALTKLSDVKNEFEFVSADIRDEGKVVKAAKGCDGIIHLAYVNGTKFFYSNPDLVLDIGIKGMLSVLSAGEKNNISELFLASSSEVYQNPASVPTPEEVQLVIPDPYNPRFSYGGGKILAELMSIHMGKKIFKKVIIFRPHNVYGPDMGEEHVIPEFIRKIATLHGTKLQIQGSGKETRSYIFIDDFAKGFMIILKKGKNMNTYNIGTQNEVSSKQLAQLIAKLLQKNITVIPGELKKGSTPKRCPDISKLKALGFSEKVSLNEGLNKTIEWYTRS